MEFPDYTKRDLVVPIDLNKIITIIGPRRSGKTWYFFQLMTRLSAFGVKREQMLYLNFEDERFDFNGDYDQIIDAYLELYPRNKLSDIYIFFDEIQELPNWEKYVRRIYDTVTKKIFITGSNAKMLSKEIATSLRGRSLTFEIMPLSFTEFLSFKNIDKTDTVSTVNKALLESSFDEYLFWGGYPEIVNVEKSFKPAILQEYFNVMIYRDLIDRYNFKDVSTVKYLIKRLVSSFTKEYSVNQLYKDLKSRGLKIGKDTVYRILEDILSVYFVSSITKYNLSVKNREMSNKKIYLYDHGFATATNYSFSEDRGKLLENLVFSRLRQEFRDIYFLKNGYECDFICFNGINPLLVQVTYDLNRDNMKREIKGLKKAGEQFSDCTYLLLYRETNIDVATLPEGINALPVVDWLLK